RLIQRRHQKHVGAGFDLMGQRLARVTFVNSDLLWRDIVQALQKVFILLRARAKRDKKRSGREHWTRDIPDQVVAFLTDESRDDGDDRSIRIFHQSKASQQIDLALALS